METYPVAKQRSACRAIGMALIIGKESSDNGVQSAGGRIVKRKGNVFFVVADSVVWNIGNVPNGILDRLGDLRCRRRGMRERLSLRNLCWRILHFAGGTTKAKANAYTKNTSKKTAFHNESICKNKHFYIFFIENAGGGIGKMGIFLFFVLTIMRACGTIYECVFRALE